jgi:hypothetical protein
MIVRRQRETGRRRPWRVLTRDATTKRKATTAAPTTIPTGKLNTPRPMKTASAAHEFRANDQPDRRSPRKTTRAQSVVQTVAVIGAESLARLHAGRRHQPDVEQRHGHQQQRDDKLPGGPDRSTDFDRQDR